MTRIATLTSGDKRLCAEELQDGVVRIHLSSSLTRRLGMNVTCYLVDDLLIDTGFPHIRNLLVSFLADRRVNAICCTHNHEDHAGNCGVLAQQHNCPVFLSNPHKLWDEGVGKLALYRRVVWGKPGKYHPEPMPEKVCSEGRALHATPTPGHSQTHAAFFDERGGNLFVGDLFVSGGVAAVMRHENPYASVESLRRVAALSPERMFNGHGLTVPFATGPLRQKADRIEEAADQVVRLHEKGVREKEIRRRIFSNGHWKDRLLCAVTGGGFSRANFIRACLVHRPTRAWRDG